MARHRFVPKTRGLGIEDWLKSKLAARPSTWPMTMAVFRSLVTVAPLTKVPILGYLVKRATLTTPATRATQGYALPLNIDLAKSIKPVTPPIELLKKAIRESTYRAAMNSCVCRDAYKCSNYPHDVACIFLGKAARVCVDNGIAHEASVEECLQRVDRAAALGLAGQSYWIEVEEYVWGFKNEDLENFLEICFCCPCCCSAMQFGRRADRESRTRYHRSVGWVAERNNNCVNCHTCIPLCPVQAIVPAKDGIAINEDCGGCGVCIQACRNHALSLKMASPTKSRLQEYFEGLKLKI